MSHIDVQFRADDDKITVFLLEKPMSDQIGRPELLFPQLLWSVGRCDRLDLKVGIPERDPEKSDLNWRAEKCRQQGRSQKTKKGRVKALLEKVEKC